MRGDGVLVTPMLRTTIVALMLITTALVAMPTAAATPCEDPGHPVARLVECVDRIVYEQGNAVIDAVWYVYSELFCC